MNNQLSQHSVFFRFKVWLLQVIIPEHIRRGMFIFSLAAWATKQQSADSVLAQQLVEKLDLAARPEVFFYAIDRSKKYWHSLDTKYDCTDSFCTLKVKDVVDQAISQMPAWMSYNTHRIMRKDAFRALRVAHTHVSSC